MSNSRSKKRTQSGTFHNGFGNTSNVNTFTASNNSNVGGTTPGMQTITPGSSNTSGKLNQTINVAAGGMNTVKTNGLKVSIGAGGMKITNADGTMVSMGADGLKVTKANGEKVNMGAVNIQPTTYCNVSWNLFTLRHNNSVFKYGSGNMVFDGTRLLIGKQISHNGGSQGVICCNGNCSCQNEKCAPTAQKRAKTETQPAPTETKSDDVTDLPVILEGEECTICFESYRRAEDMKFLPCAHFFHRRCVENWQVIDNTCPVCRMNAVTTERAETR